MVAARGKKVADIVVILNWIVLGCVTVSAVGFFAYHAGEFTVIADVLEEFESAINSTNDTDTYEEYNDKTIKDADRRKAVPKADGNNYADLRDDLESTRARMIRKGKILTVDIVVHAVLTILLTVAVRKQHFLLLCIWLGTNSFVKIITEISLVRHNVVNDQVNDFGFEWHMYEFLRLTWMGVSALPILYFFLRFSSVGEPTYSEKIVV